MNELRPCGTRAAYERHRVHREPQDEACLEANREEGKDLRAHWGRCRTRAYAKLVALHAEEFEQLRAEERAKDPGRDAYSRARQRALRRLGKRHPAAFRELLDKERAEDGDPR